MLLSRNKKKCKLLNSFSAEVQNQICFFQQIFKFQGKKCSLQCCFLFSLDKQMSFWLMNRKGVRKCLLGSVPSGEPELVPTGAGCEDYITTSLLMRLFLMKICEELRQRMQKWKCSLLSQCTFTSCCLVTSSGCWTKLAIQANEVKDMRWPLKICDGGRKLLYIYNRV